MCAHVDRDRSAIGRATSDADGAGDGSVVDAFRVVKDHRGRPTQRELSAEAVAARYGTGR